MASRSEPIGKRELLSRIRKARDTVASLLTAIPPTALLQSDAIDRWSVRDLLAHFVAHEQRALAEIAAGRRGERLESDPTGIDHFNAGPCLHGHHSGRQKCWRPGIGRTVAL
jgi:hypothetical protein